MGDMSLSGILNHQNGAPLDVPQIGNWFETFVSEPADDDNLTGNPSVSTDVFGNALDDIQLGMATWAQTVTDQHPILPHSEHHAHEQYHIVDGNSMEWSAESFPHQEIDPVLAVDVGDEVEQICYGMVRCGPGNCLHEVNFAILAPFTMKLT